MFITVGIGNTNVAIGLVDGRKLTVEREPKDAFQTAKDFTELLNTALLRCGAGREEIEGSIVACVVPQLMTPCTDALADFTGEKPLAAGAHLKTDIDFSEYTGLLGSDRIAVCAAAWDRFKAPFVAIDMGTATTFNAVDRNGIFLGGAILPGVRMGMEALNRNTAQLPDVSLKKPLGVIGHDTRECLLAGAYYGAAAAVDGLTQRMTELLGNGAKVVLTGGNAGTVLPLIKTRLLYEPDLLLEGLAVLYRENSRVAVHAADAVSRPD